MVHPCRYHKSKYCSSECYRLTKRPNVTMVCPQCGMTFTQWASKTDKCCSRVCADAFKTLPVVKKDSKELLSLLREFVSYDPETGILIWIKKQTGWKASIEPGTIVSFKRKDGYLQLTVRSKKILAHRAAWALHYGEWPKKHLDHINRIKTDNRISNLRLATRSQNHHNKAAKNNTGVSGVYKRKQRFHAQIGHNGKLYHVGSFPSVEEAAKARRRKARELGIEEFLPN